MFEYGITIKYDKNDKIYVAKIPDLRGCMAHGDTPEEAIKELLVAYELRVEVAAEMGEMLPEPSSVSARNYSP